MKENERIFGEKQGRCRMRIQYGLSDHDNVERFLVFVNASRA